MLFTLAGVWAIALISPGPDFAATVQYATAHSRRHGIFVALGVTSALTFWIIGSMVGLGLLLARASWLIEVIRTLGAVYLMYLGVRTILHAHRPLTELTGKAAETNSFAAWRVGFLTNIGNPKAVAFFSSIFILFLPANSPLWIQATTTMLMLIMAAGWFCIVACFFSLGPITSAYRRAKRWLDYITGGIFIALGLRLALER